MKTKTTQPTQSIPRKKRKTGRTAKLTKNSGSLHNSSPGAESGDVGEPQFNAHRLVEVRFHDRIGRLCILGEGFQSTEPTVMQGGAGPAEKIGHLSRMDLGQKEVKGLPFLEHFPRTGKLPKPEGIRFKSEWVDQGLSLSCGNGSIH